MTNWIQLLILLNIPCEMVWRIDNINTYFKDDIGIIKHCLSSLMPLRYLCVIKNRSSFYVSDCSRSKVYIHKIIIHLK